MTMVLILVLPAKLRVDRVFVPRMYISSTFGMVEVVPYVLTPALSNVTIRSDELLTLKSGNASAEWPMYTVLSAPGS